jgi:hypothetical protein
VNVDPAIKIELIKGLISGASGIVLLSLTWLIGQRLTYLWTVRQKRRELQLASLQQFYIAYGEFFAVWKLWDRIDELEPGPAVRVERRWELLKRATAAESIVEGTFVRLSLEVDIDGPDVINLGRFRQAFQQLRESIRDNKPLAWPHANCPEYRSFKRLSIDIGTLLNGDPSKSSRSRQSASDRLMKITSNEWEDNWILPEFKEDRPKSAQTVKSTRHPSE